MALDTELMVDEFMHGFGDCTVGLRESLYEVAAASGKFDLIPEKIGEGEFRRHYIEYLEYSTRNPLEKVKVDKNISNACEFYRALDGLVGEVANQNEKYSHCFRLVQTFMELLKQPMLSFEEYLRLHKDSEDFEQSFSHYLPQLEVAVPCINGIMAIREIYDSTTDGREVRMKWSKKHPEFNRGEWKLPVSR